MRIGISPRIREETAMNNRHVRIYTDYKSPYAFAANQRLFALEDDHGLELEWLPYTLPARWSRRGTGRRGIAAPESGSVADVRSPCEAPWS
jgi:2-hydroxychromene-2-carboxylate isomerase